MSAVKRLASKDVICFAVVLTSTDREVVLAQVLKTTLSRLAVSAHVFTDEPLLAALELLFAAPPGFIPAKVGPFSCMHSCSTSLPAADWLHREGNDGGLGTYTELDLAPPALHPRDISRASSGFHQTYKLSK